jgi:hypothetical protein
MTEMNVAARGAFDFQLLVPFTKYATDLGFPPGDVPFQGYLLFLTACTIGLALENRYGVFTLPA